MLGIVSLLSHFLSELFVRSCLIDFNTTHLIHLFEFLETVCGYRLCSSVMKKWRVVTVFFRYYS